MSARSTGGGDAGGRGTGGLDARALDAGLAARIEADRRDRIARIGAEAVAWLALAPEWTRRVAAAAGFPSLDAVLTEAVEAGWCVAERHRLDRRGALVRARLLATTIRELPAATTPWLRRQLCAEVLAAVPQIGSDATKATLLVQIARGLPGELTADARAVAAAVMDPAQRAYALAVTGADPSTVDPLGAEDRLRVAAVLGDAAGVAAAAVECAAPYAELVQLLGDVAPAVLAPAVATLEAGPPSTEDDPADRAAVLAATGGLLPASSAELAQARVEASLTSVHPSIGALILVDLAALAAARGRPDDALGFAERILDEGLRLEAYAAAVRAHPPLAAAVAGIAEPVARAAAETAEPGQEGCVALVETLAAAGAGAAAESLATLLTDRRGHPDAIAALARAAVALRSAGRVRAADRIVRAIGSAVLPDDRTVRATAKLRSLPALAPQEAARVAEEARIAAEEAEEPDAAVLARLLPYVADAGAPALLRRVLELTAPAGSDAGFWMPDAARPDVLAALAAQHGTAWLRAVSVTAAGRVRSPEVQALAVPATLRQWVNLAGTAQDPSGAATARRLESACGPLLESGAVGEALGWVETARLLLPVIGGELETSVLLVSRRAELAQRREQDRRHLERFLVRRGPVEEFDQLLAEPDDGGRWALHYLGQGGIGKTTLLRYLTARLAPERGIITSRVDFDHLDPDYPLRRPGQLLLELLQELGAHATAGGADTFFRRVDRQLRDLRHWAPDDTALDALAALDSPAMLAAIEGFCEFLRLLPRRVVLVLDTCEEVAKFRPEAGRMPQLVAMFTLLERIHAAVPSVRVVLAGRRPLVRASAAGVAPLPSGQPYLRVAEVRGFSRSEASQYVTDRVGLTLPAADLDRLLALCPEPVPRSGEVRYSPFDLAQHAAAVREDPGYLHATAQLGADPYVEHRIVRRLREPARGLLAAVVALRRFDREMLEAATTAPHRDRLAEAWFELAATEWLEYRVHPPLDTPFLEVHGSLLDRLERYFERYPQHHERLEAQRALGLRLPGLVDTRPLDRLRVEHVDAALRCAPPDRAATLCDSLARRVVSEQAWGWAETVFARILSTDGALADAAHPATAGARALYAAAAGKISAATPLVPIWTEVADAVATDPGAGWLRLRAEHAAIGRGADRRPALHALLAAASVAVPAGTPHIDPAPPPPGGAPAASGGGLGGGLGLAYHGGGLVAGAGGVLGRGADGRSLGGTGVGTGLGAAGGGSTAGGVAGGSGGVAGGVGGSGQGGVGGTIGGVGGAGFGEALGWVGTGGVGGTGGAGLQPTSPQPTPSLVVSEMSGIGTAVGATLGIPPGTAAGSVLGRWAPGNAPEPGTSQDGGSRTSPGGAAGVRQGAAVGALEGRVAGRAPGELSGRDVRQAVAPGGAVTGGPGELSGRDVRQAVAPGGAVTGEPGSGFRGPLDGRRSGDGTPGETGAAGAAPGQRLTSEPGRHGAGSAGGAGGAAVRAIAIAVGDDGAAVVAGDAAGTLRVWDFGSVRAVTPPRRAHAGAVLSVAVLRLGGRPVAVSGGTDGCVRWWPVEPGPAADLPVLRGAGAVTGLAAVDGAGGPVVAVLRDGRVRLWPAGAPDHLAREVIVPGLPVTALAAVESSQATVGAPQDTVDSGGAVLVVGAGSGVVRVDPRTATAGAASNGAAAVHAVAVTSAGGPASLAVVAAKDGARVHDLGVGGGVRKLAGAEVLVHACAVAPDGRWFATGDADGAVRLWDAASGEPLRVLRSGGAVLACAVAPDGTWVAAAGGDDAARLWDAATGRPLAELGGHEGGVWGCAAGPDGTWVVTADGAGVLRRYATAGGPPVWEFPHGGGLRGCAVTPDGRGVVVGAAGGAVHLHDAQTGALRRTLEGHAGGAWACVVAPDGRWVATAGADGAVRLWDAETGAPLRTLTGAVGPLWDCAVAPDGRWLAAAGNDGAVRIWSATGASGPVLTGHAAGVWGVAIAPDGTWLVAGGRDVRAWDAATGRRRLALSGAVPEAGPATAVAAGTLDGRPIALTGATDGRIHAWDLRAGVPLGAPIAGHDAAVTAIALATVQGRTVAATGAADGTVRFWDLAEGWRRARLLLGDALAAVSARLDQIERSPDRDVRALGVGRAQVDELAALAEACGAAAYARMLRARLAWLSGDVDEADRLAGEALAALPDDPSAPLDPFVGADWDAPAVTADRVRLELARLAGRPVPVPARPPGEPDRSVTEPDRPLAVSDQSPAHPEAPLTDPDRSSEEADRLLAEPERMLARADRVLLLDAAGRAGNPDADRLASITLLHMLAHRVVDRGTVVAVEQALGSTVTPPATVAAHEAVPPLRVALARAWGALGGAAEARAALDRGRVADRPTMDVFDDALLDLAVLLNRDWGRHLRQTSTSQAAVRARTVLDPSAVRPPDPYPREREGPPPQEWWWRHRNQPDAAARRALLDAALFGGDEPPALDWLEPALGARRIAEIALEEGRLLAVYRPAAGQRLLRWAADRFAVLGEQPQPASGHSVQAPVADPVPAPPASPVVPAWAERWAVRSQDWRPLTTTCGILALGFLVAFGYGLGLALLPVAVALALVPAASIGLDWLWEGLPRWSRTWRRTPRRVLVSLRVGLPGPWVNSQSRMLVSAEWKDPAASARVAVPLRQGADADAPGWPRRRARRAAAVLAAADRAGLLVPLHVLPSDDGVAWEVPLAQGAGVLLDTRRIWEAQGATLPADPGWTVLAGPIRRTLLRETMAARDTVEASGAVTTGLLAVAGLAVLVDGQPRITVEALTVHPDDLPMDRLRLVLVIADATEPGPDNALLRRCCGDLMRAGAAAVVLVPAMPLQHLGPVLAPFAALTDVPAAGAGPADDSAAGAGPVDDPASGAGPTDGPASGAEVTDGLAADGEAAAVGGEVAAGGEAAAGAGLTGIPAAVRAAREELARRTDRAYAAEMTFFQVQTGSEA
ncbi:hypothetical protein ACQEVZ_44260 [Dactylosporangium sp. CA-152071]|uniref:hypothetical protein n=1 Tax=Dactylosporangium sp. CA-152071 TaxID=3239933 RepID=UPI003D8B4407